MQLNKSEKEFLSRYKEQLRIIFQKRIADMKEDVFVMPKGDTRDYMIDFIEEAQRLVNILLAEEHQPKDWKDDI